MESICRDPFRVLFPLGWLLGLVGVLGWVPFAWTETPHYPGGFHAVLMSRGFLSGFVLGFLMTAIPRFTETEYARPWEVGIALLSLLVSAALAPGGRSAAAELMGLFQILLILVFIARRFSKRRSNPPGAFVFIAVGLLLGAAGSLIEWMGTRETMEISGFVLVLGRLLSFYGMLLALVLGVGSRLFPGILGWSEIVSAQRQQYEKAPSFLAGVPADLYLGVILFVASFLLEAFYQEAVGRGLRAAFVLYVALRYWRIHRRPPKATPMNWALLGAAWFVVLGEILSAVFPHWGLDGRHIVFVGGFSLMALLVGARVTLAHGEGTAFEARPWPYLPLAGLILLSSVARTSVLWTPRTYFLHLAYAAIVWALGALVWGWVFLPRIGKGLVAKK